MEACTLIPIATGLLSSGFGYLLGRLLTQSPDDKFSGLNQDLTRKLELANETLLKNDKQITIISAENIQLQQKLSSGGFDASIPSFVDNSGLHQTIADLENKLQLANIEKENAVNEVRVQANNVATTFNSSVTDNSGLHQTIADLENKLQLAIIEKDNAVNEVVNDYENKMQLLASTPTSNTSADESTTQRLAVLEKNNSIYAKNENAYKQHIAMLEQRLSSMSNTVNTEDGEVDNNLLLQTNHQLQQRVLDLEKVIASGTINSEEVLLSKIADLEMELSKAKTNTPTAFDAKTAQAIYGKKVNQDDLKLVEGIGPKIEELFHKVGINTWLKLSNTSVDRCNEILVEEGGERYKIHNPKTWAQQSALMHQGKWEELKQWQDEMKGGIEK